MPELKDQIRTYFETVAPPMHAGTQSPEPWWRLRPLAAALAGAAVVAVPILVVWAISGRATEPDPTIPPAITVTTTLAPPTTTAPIEEEPSTATTATPPTTSAPEPVETIGQWTLIPDAPWGYPHTIRAWTGTELLVFPEYVYDLDAPTTGMAYNPSSTEWRELSAPPELRAQSAAVWTGLNLLVWGGTVEDSVDGYTLSNTGFSFDPVTDEWTAIPPAPLDPQTFPFHAWTGEELIVWGGSVVVNDIFLGATTVGAAYNPTTGVWRTLSESPLGSRNPGVGIWTGTEMIIGGNGDQTDGDASWAAYEPVSDTWRQLPDPPVRAGLVYNAVWTGTEVIFTVSNRSGSVQPQSDVYAFDPSSNEWRQATSPGQSLSQAGSTWTGTYVIYWGDTGHPGRPLAESAYDPKTDSWVLLAEAPMRDRFSDGNPPLIAPGTILFWGGSGYDLELNTDGAILVVETDSAVGLTPTQTDTDLIASLLLIGADSSRAADLSWDPEGVALGLGETIVKTVDPAELIDAATWSLDVPDYGGATGPFSVLAGIARLIEADDTVVQVGLHNHCAGIARDAPAGFETMRRLSVQPVTTDSCLQWWTIDLFLTDDGLIRAVTYDFWEP